MPTTIHTVASTDMHPQLDNPFSDRFAVTEISCLHLAQPNADTSLSNFIAQSVQPISERLIVAAGIADPGMNFTLRLTACCALRKVVSRRLKLLSGA